MSDEHPLPDPGSVEVASPDEAAEIVEEVAADARERMLIALDVDGTVLLEDGTHSPDVVGAIADAQAAGHEVTIATGRSWETTDAILAALGMAPEYVVCANGAIVMKREGEGYVRFHVESFDPTEVLRMLREHLPHARYLIELTDGRRLYTEYLDHWNLDQATKVSFDELGAHPVTRVVVVSPDDSERDFLDLVARIGLTEVSYSIGWTAWLDIAPRGVDKGSALELVRSWLGIDPARVLVIGDGRNDIGMFIWAIAGGGRAVAMAQGPQEVRDAAGETTASVEAGGVAAVLRALSGP